MEDQAGQATGIMYDLMLGAGAVGMALWGVYERIVRLRVEKASNGAEVAVAAGQETLFNLMRQRLELVEAEIVQLRSELAVERGRNRDMELYVFQLQNMMAENGISVPPHTRSPPQ